MLSKQALNVARTQCRGYSSARGIQPVRVLPNASLETFRQQAFEPAIPALLPRKSFIDLPAIDKWFVKSSSGIGLNADHLARYGDSNVPLEISNDESFSRVEQPLSVFIDASTLPTQTARIYLAQAPIADLAPGLRADISTPPLVLQAGKGDVYDSSIWLGRAPTYTPLHCDPNPNLFVQLAGTKIVRLFRPDVGQRIFARVQEKIGGSASATMRGEEMMMGREKVVLEREVWGGDAGDRNGQGERVDGFEAELESGDGLFIPKGWWHSVKGVGEDMTGSVNWWFR